MKFESDLGLLNLGELGEELRVLGVLVCFLFGEKMGFLFLGNKSKMVIIGGWVYYSLLRGKVRLYRILLILK